LKVSRKNIELLKFMNLLNIFNKIREWILLDNPECSDSLKNCNRLQLEFPQIGALTAIRDPFCIAKSLNLLKKRPSLGAFPRLVR